jgi:hypothetical protein
MSDEKGVVDRALDTAISAAKKLSDAISQVAPEAWRALVLGVRVEGIGRLVVTGLFLVYLVYLVATLSLPTTAFEEVLLGVKWGLGLLGLFITIGMDPVQGAVQVFAPESVVIEKIANKLRYL